MKTLTITRQLAIAWFALPYALCAIDTDSDGLDDAVETNTGTYVSLTNTGTNPNNPDSDGDGAGDWYEVAIIDVDPTAAQPNSPNNAALKPNIPYPLPAPTNTPPATNKPVKVFILSGQSNMVGQGNISPLGTAGTLETLTRNEKKFPNLLNGAGWSVRNDVMYRGVIAATGNSALTPGHNNGTTTIGPEIGFGHVMGYHHDEPVLIIKSSEGGRALGWDFVPPGSVPYTYGASTIAGYGNSPSSWATGTTPVADAFYGGYQFDQCFLRKADWAPAGAANSATTNVATVLDNWQTDYAGPGKPFEGMSFEIAGFAWFHGWNDGLSSSAALAYRYEQNMAQFIRQLRAYYETRYPGKIKPKAPFVIATAAFEGWNEAYLNQYPTRRAVLNAQHAVSNDAVKYPDFVGNVKTMEARGYWRDKAISPIPGGGQGYHYNRHAETFLLVGDALGRGMIDLLASVTPDTLSPTITGLSPLDNATSLATSVNLVLTFNEAIARGTGDILLKNLTNGTQIPIAITDGSQVSLDGTFLTINPSANLLGGKNYAIQIPANAIKDLSNNSFAGIADDTTWNFTTLAPDVTAPAIASLSPSDNATGVAVGANLTLTFNEPIVLGSGNITIKNLSNSTQTIIPVSDASKVSLSGAILTVNPSSNLAGNSNLAIRVDAGAVKDLANNPSTGITDDTTWNFATAAPPSGAAVTFNNFVSAYIAGTTKTFTFNASASDKLVVIVSGEHNFGGSTAGNVKSVTYDGVSLVKAVEQNPFSTTLATTSDLWYLDNPGSVHTAGQIVITVEGNGNNYVHAAMGMSGTAPGFSGASSIAIGAATVNMNVSSPKSLVISWLTLGGSGNTAGTATTIQSSSPAGAIKFGGVVTGGNYAGHVLARSSGLTAGANTFSFNTGLTDVLCLSAEFKASDIPPNPYAVWSAQHPSADTTNPSADTDTGGLPVGIEWVAGGNPTLASDDAGLAPTFDITADPNGKFLFRYRRSDAAKLDPNTTIAVEYGSDLAGWTVASHQGTGASDITISEVPDGPGFAEVTVALPYSLDVSGTLFARLKVVVVFP